MKMFSIVLLCGLTLLHTSVAQNQRWPSTTDYPTTTEKPISNTYDVDGTVVLNVKCPSMPKTCKDVKGHGDAVKTVLDNGIELECDLETDGGGWAIIQKRAKGDTDFYRDWKDYKYGFGTFDTDYWLGLEKVHQLTFKRCYELRIDMEYRGKNYYAKYSDFKVLSEIENYELQIGDFSGDAGDSLSIHNHMSFSTKDRDNDKVTMNCAERYHGAWWYNSCHKANLNGIWGSRDYGQGLTWFTLTSYYNTVSYSVIKIRPCYD